MKNEAGMGDGNPRPIGGAWSVRPLCQSSSRRQLRISDRELSMMPALAHEQLRVFRFGPLPGLEPLTSVAA